MKRSGVIRRWLHMKNPLRTMGDYLLRIILCLVHLSKTLWILLWLIRASNWWGCYLLTDEKSRGTRFFQSADANSGWPGWKQHYPTYIGVVHSKFNGTATYTTSWLKFSPSTTLSTITIQHGSQHCQPVLSLVEIFAEGQNFWLFVVSRWTTHHRRKPNGLKCSSRYFQVCF